MLELNLRTIEIPDQEQIEKKMYSKFWMLK